MNRLVSKYVRSIRSFRSEIGRTSPEDQNAGVLQSIRDYRYFIRWVRYLNDAEHVLENGIPWFNFESIDWLESILNKRMSVFEYSAGASTLFFSERVNRVISVEHNEEWYRVVLDRIADAGLKNCELILAKPEDDDSHRQREYSIPEDCISTDPNYRNMTFLAYVKSIDPFPDNVFDIVLVDGRARTSCVAHAMPKIKVGGYLILDNSERNEYRGIHATLDNANWDKRSFYGPGPYVYNFWGTTFWKRLK